MARYQFLTYLKLVFFGLILLSTASCKKTFTLFKASPYSSDTAYANTDQRILEWEYKKKEKLFKKQQRQEAKLAKRGESKSIQKVIQTARTYRGTPYKYGGTTRIGMDCSGLLCTSFKAININLPRSSNEQSRFGPEIKSKDIREGDLVFFGAAKNSNQITHVGLVTDVKSKEEVYFIHASTSLGVIEDNLFGNHYKAIFIKAVRPPI